MLFSTVIATWPGEWQYDNLGVQALVNPLSRLWRLVLSGQTLVAEEPPRELIVDVHRRIEQKYRAQREVAEDSAALQRIESEAHAELEDALLRVYALHAKPVNLSSRSLSFANFQRMHALSANLQNVDLSRTNLSDADLRFTDLSGADLTRANLIHARFGSAVLVNSDFSQANLFRADFAYANLSGAQLERSGLFQIDLAYADLSQANFSGADLRYANLRHANLTKANFADADLRSTILIDAQLKGASLANARLDGAKVGTSLEAANNWYSNARSSVRGFDDARWRVAKMEEKEPIYDMVVSKLEQWYGAEVAIWMLVE